LVNTRTPAIDYEASRASAPGEGVELEIDNFIAREHKRLMEDGMPRDRARATAEDKAFREAELKRARKYAEETYHSRIEWLRHLAGVYLARHREFVRELARLEGRL
jgi:hypothetical protein